MTTLSYLVFIVTDVNLRMRTTKAECACAVIAMLPLNRRS